MNLRDSKGFWAFLVAFMVWCQIANAAFQSYKAGNQVDLYVNKVGPFWNPHETYHYYSLPICRPEKIEHRSLTLGEVLDGDRMAKSLYHIRFREQASNEKLCKVKLTVADVHKLQSAIEDLYYFEFVVDDIPMRGFVGQLEETNLIVHKHTTYIYTHYDFAFEYNGDHVIFADVSTSSKNEGGKSPTLLTDANGPISLEFTYSVTWKETNVKVSQRSKLANNKNGKNKFFPKSFEIHWLSVINSVLLVVFLLGFVVIILMRVLRNDFSRYNNNANAKDGESGVGASSEEFMDGEDYGWKLISNDVFRFPQNKIMFCSALGVGTQFLALTGGIIAMALIGLFNIHKHGSLNTVAILLYAFTSCIAGFISSKVYKQMGGDKWVLNINLTVGLFMLPFLLTWSLINSVNWFYGSTQALPVTTIILLAFVWLVVGYPLTIIGGIVARNTTPSSFDAPCRTKNISREIPAVPYYRTLPVSMCVGGFLPFSAISVELYYIFSTVWGRDSYTLYGILTIVLVILLSVTACISIALTYFQLASEDYRWWWRSMFTSGSTGIFVFLYSIYFYYQRSNMTGGLQTVQFFGYSFIACYIFSLMLGAVGYFSSLKFVRYIYRNVKID